MKEPEPNLNPKFAFFPISNNYFCQGDCFLWVFVCLLAGLFKNYSADFHKIQWKGGMLATKETIRFWWLNLVTFGLGLGLDGGNTILWMGGCVTQRLTVTVLRHQQSWQRYALYWASF